MSRYGEPWLYTMNLLFHSCLLYYSLIICDFHVMLINLYSINSDFVGIMNIVTDTDNNLQFFIHESSCFEDHTLRIWYRRIWHTDIFLTECIMPVTYS